MIDKVGNICLVLSHQWTFFTNLFKSWSKLSVKTCVIFPARGTWLVNHPDVGLCIRRCYLRFHETIHISINLSELRVNMLNKGELQVKTQLNWPEKRPYLLIQIEKRKYHTLKIVHKSMKKKIENTTPSK